MQIILLTHPNGQQAVCIDHDGWRAQKAVAKQTEDAGWRESQVQFPLLTGDPRVLVISPEFPQDAQSGPRKIRKTRGATKAPAPDPDPGEEPLVNAD